LRGSRSERIAEAARGGPDHRVDVRGILDEVLLAELQRDLLALHLRDVGRDLAFPEAIEHVVARLNL